LSADAGFVLAGVCLGSSGSIVGSRAKSVPILIGAETFLGSLEPWHTHIPLFRRARSDENPFCCHCRTFCFRIAYKRIGPAISNAFILHTRPDGDGVIIFNHSERHLDNGLGSVLPPPTFRMKNRDESRIHILKQFDYIGIILYTGGLLVFLIGLSWGGSAYPWKSAHVITTVVVGFCAIVAFFFWQSFTTVEHPFGQSGFSRMPILWHLLVSSAWAQVSTTLLPWCGRRWLQLSTQMVIRCGQVGFRALSGLELAQAKLSVAALPKILAR